MRKFFNRKTKIIICVLKFFFSQNNFFQKNLKRLSMLYGIYLYAVINAWLIKLQIFQKKNFAIV